MEQSNQSAWGLMQSLSPKLMTDAKSKLWWRDLPTRFVCRQGGCGSRKRIDKAQRSDFAKANSLEQIEAHKASCDQLNKHFFTKYLKINIIFRCSSKCSNTSLSTYNPSKYIY